MSEGRESRRRHGRSRLRLLFGGLALLALSACTLEPASDHGGQIRGVYQLTFVFAAVIFVVVTFAIVYSAIRFRSKPNDDTLPPQIHGSTKLEIAWTVIPSIIVLVLFVASAVTLGKLDSAEASPMTINITGFQWQWKFTYPDFTLDDGTPLAITGTSGLPGEGLGKPTLALPLDRPVHFHLESSDVIHSFYIPVFLYKRDVVPGFPNDFTLTPDRAGTFGGKCAELCGVWHSEMLFIVKILPQDQFDAYMQNQLAIFKRNQGTGTCTQPITGTLPIVAKNIAFDTNCLQQPAGQPVKLAFDNQDAGIPHNVDIYKDQDFTQHVAGANGPSEIITGVSQTTYDIQALPAGTYYFKCDIHPQMQGQYLVE